MRLTHIFAATVFAALAPASARADDIAVDLELVLAVDVSRSMTERELEIQRRGYAEALASEEVGDAIGRGMIGQIALTFIEWAGSKTQNVVIGWTLVRGPDDAQAIAARLSTVVPAGMQRTSISGIIDHAAASFENNGFDGLRRVIDISGDGPNNQGRPVEAARDDALARGIEINGLPLMTREGMGSQWHLDDLDEYYRNCVIGGPASFVLPVLDWMDFPQSVRRKLVLELAGRPPPRDEALIRPVQGAGYDCFAGEKIWNGIRDDWN